MARGWGTHVAGDALDLAAVRAPAVSGRFYPGTQHELEGAVRGLLAQVPDAVPGPARGALAPHAGYLYSGITAACVFARLTIPPLVVILAPNHTGVCRAPGGASLWEAGVFRTPLGDVTVDEHFAALLLGASPLLAADHEAHRAEHAIEVQLPFLQVLRSEHPRRTVPVVLAWDAWTECRALGLALAQLVNAMAEPVLLLASSDLNHYEPASVSERKDRWRRWTRSAVWTARSCSPAAGAVPSPCAGAPRPLPSRRRPARSARWPGRSSTTGIRAG